ncbi:autoinducer binding domain-containing protein [Roseisalinus antarcticus]|uniref:Transcriptional activator protein LuxR n=1 Tax=Roseisalinus antarcticus TaxID=254357 RepID=A0A1Y5RAY0_9RHOB|nr:autoinducer binding domain-containing protein [Roseisalinus antarcticus]SLN12858.1 Transcriptional activator protein LuxR [Roseisalinus antarcticus]
MSMLSDYLDALTNAATVESLWRQHTDRMAEYGFDRLIYGFTRYRFGESLGDPQDWVVLTNQSPEYMERFIDEGLYHHAPMLHWALENDGACSWRWIAQPGNLTAEEQRVVAVNISMGVVAGYTISFRSVSERSKGAIALTARPGLTQADVEEIWEKHGSEIVVMNNVAHLKLLSLPYSGARTLTKRQREVLQWVGDGKTTQDVALLLGVSPATVEKHLRLAREALDVETTAQAILKAAFYNQMFVFEA